MDRHSIIFLAAQENNMTIDNKTLELIEAALTTVKRANSIGHVSSSERYELAEEVAGKAKTALIAHLTAWEAALNPPTNVEMSEAWGRMADGRARWNGEDLRGVSEFLRQRRYLLNHPAAPAQAPPAKPRCVWRNYSTSTECYSALEDACTSPSMDFDSETDEPLYTSQWSRVEDPATVE